MRLPEHTYEEVRDAVVAVISGHPGRDQPNQFRSLVTSVSQYFRQLDPVPRGQGVSVYTPLDEIHAADAENVRDVFWDLFRQGYITLGLNDSNDAYPFFKLSRFGETSLGNASQDRFHDADTYLALVSARAPNLTPATITYLREAVSSFYAGCYLSTCVMLGVAAESEFVRLTEDAASSSRHPGIFAACAKESFIKTKIERFQRALMPLRGSLAPRKKFENLDANLTSIQAVLRVARNDAGHPTGAEAPGRDQVFVFLHLFPALAEQINELRKVLV